MQSSTDIAFKLISKFNPAAAAEQNLIFGFRIDETHVFSFRIHNGQCHFKQGDDSGAHVTLVMDGTTWEDIVTGKVDGMQAFMAGKLNIEGDMMLAMKLGEIFPV